MTTVDLKHKVEKYRQWLRGASGSAVVCSENGPANMGVIDQLVQALEEHERRLVELERRMATLRV